MYHLLADWNHEQLHAHSNTARFIAKLHQSADVKPKLTVAPAAIKLGLEAAEALPAGSDQPWLCWRSLDRLHPGIGRAKTTMRRWGYIDNMQKDTREEELTLSEAMSVNETMNSVSTLPGTVGCQSTSSLMEEKGAISISLSC